MSAPRPVGEAAKKIEDEATAWFVRMHSDARSAADAREFDAWFDANPEHQIAYRALQNLWCELAIYSDAPALKAERHEAKAEIERNGRRLGPRAIGFAMFGGVLAAAACAGLMFWPRPDPAQIYQTGPGERTTITLADRSIVSLGPNAQLIVRLDDDVRQAELTRGRAFFDVEHDANRPFHVVADGRDVSVLGTQFEVDAEQSDISVTLVAGRVAISGPDGHERVATLAPGQRFEEQGNAMRIVEVNAQTETAWRSGRLVFDDRPLGEAIVELNRFSPTPISLADASLADYRVSGTFRIGETAALIDALEASFPIEGETLPHGGVILSRR